mgnify:CR=1 FL=1
MDGQATTVTDTAVAADLGQALDVQSHFTAEVALNGEVLVDHITQLCFLLVGQVLDAGVRIDLGELLRPSGGTTASYSALLSTAPVQLRQARKAT